MLSILGLKPRKSGPKAAGALSPKKSHLLGLVSIPQWWTEVETWFWGQALHSVPGLIPKTPSSEHDVPLDGFGCPPLLFLQHATAWFMDICIDFPIKHYEFCLGGGRPNKPTLICFLIWRWALRARNGSPQDLGWDCKSSAFLYYIFFAF